MPKQTPERIIDRRRSGNGYYTPGPGRTPVAGPDGLIALEWIPQGEGSGLNADMVDGQHASAFAPADHLHDDRYSQLGHLHDDRYSQLGHDHDERYSRLGHDHDEAYAAIDHVHSGGGVFLELRDLTDVDSAYVDGSALVYNGSTQLWEATNIYPITLDQILDVDVSVLTDGDYLGYDSTTAMWRPFTPPEIPDPGNVATDTIWDAKGDLAVGTANNSASRLGVGSDGQVLTADSTQATGVKWASLPEAPEPQPNLGFAYVTIPTNSSQYYGLVHRYETLRLSFFENSSSSSLRVYYGETPVYESPGAGGTVTVDVDLSGFGLTVGAIYSVRLRASNADTTTVYFMAEVAD